MMLKHLFSNFNFIQKHFLQICLYIYYLINGIGPQGYMGILFVSYNNNLKPTSVLAAVNQQAPRIMLNLFMSMQLL